MHQFYQVRREQGILRRVIQFEGMTFQDLRFAKTCLDELLDEDTLRQGPRYSTGPGRGMGQYLGRKILLVQGQVGDAQSPSGPEDAVGLGEDPALASG